MRGTGIVKASTSLVVEDLETSELIQNSSTEIVYGEDSIKLDIYREEYGNVIADASVTLEAVQNDTKTEYTLTLDIDKLFMGYNSIYDYVYDEYWEEWYEECIATTSDFLEVDAIIRFVTEK
jgi:hypothetical protein